MSQQEEMKPAAVLENFQGTQMVMAELLLELLNHAF